MELFNGHRPQCIHEAHKATVVARMISGRYRTDYLARHWSGNYGGYCQLCDSNELGDLPHMILRCERLSNVRQSMKRMALTESAFLVPLKDIFQTLISSTEDSFLQFLLEPSVFPDVVALWELYGLKVKNRIYYINRTFLYYIHRERMKILGFLT